MRIIRGCVGAIALLIACAVSAMAADYSGTWVMDASKSEGMPPGVEQTMTVRHTGDRVEVDTVITGPMGERKHSDFFVLDGKETEFTPPVPPGVEVEKGRRVSRRAADGTGFEVSESATLPAPDGAKHALTATRRWLLGSDGQSLVVELVVDGPQGKQRSRRVFARKP